MTTVISLTEFPFSVAGCLLECISYDGCNPDDGRFRGVQRTQRCRPRAWQGSAACRRGWLRVRSFNPPMNANFGSRAIVQKKGRLARPHLVVVDRVKLFPNRPTR